MFDGVIGSGITFTILSTKVNSSLILARNGTTNKFAEV